MTDKSTYLGNNSFGSAIDLRYDNLEAEEFSSLIGLFRVEIRRDVLPQAFHKIYLPRCFINYHMLYIYHNLKYVTENMVQDSRFYSLKPVNLKVVPSEGWLRQNDSVLDLSF